MSDQQSIPQFISAEAAVRSNRGDYLSIFDTSATVTKENVKRFYSDGQLLKDAVAEMKEAGITVSSIGKFSIHLVASREIFEEVFAVKLILANESGVNFLTVEGSSEKGFIDTIGGPFGHLLAGVLLGRLENTLFSCSKEPPMTNEQVKEMGGIALEDVWALLGGKGKRPGFNRPVAILDSGLYTEHPYFEDYPNLHRKNPSALTESQNILLKRIQKISLVLSKVPASIGREVNDKNKMTAELDDVKLEFTTNQLQIEGIDDTSFDEAKSQILSEDNIPSARVVANEFLQSIREKLQRTRQGLRDSKKEIEKSDPNGHGTMVTSHLLAITPNAEVTVWKRDDPSATSSSEQNRSLAIKEVLEEIFKEDLSKVICCSWGETLPDDTSLSTKITNSWAATIQSHPEKIVLFAIGNSDHRKRTIQASLAHNGVIVVGGAYRKDEKVTASSTSHGYSYETGVDPPTQMIPNICGWTGVWMGDNVFGIGFAPKPKRPDKPDDTCWFLGSGTSDATAHITALSAVMSNTLHDAIEVGDLKRMLKLTAEPLVDGKFWDAVTESEQVFSQYPGVGLTNIDNALKLARLCQEVLAAKTSNLNDVLNDLETHAKGGFQASGTDPLILYIDGQRKNMDYKATRSHLTGPSSSSNT